MNNNWAKAIVYAAGMQGACSQQVADTVLSEAQILHESTENTIEYCLSRAMSISNERGESKFNESLINWLLI